MIARHRTWIVALACATVLLGGCSSVVDGSGKRIGSSGTGSARPTGSPTASTTPTTTAYPRTARSTALGDPVTADICRAVGLPAMSTFGYLPEFSDVVIPPSCAVRMSKGGTRFFTVNMFAGYSGTVTTATGRVVSRQSGLTVYSFPYDKTSGSCERDIAVPGATLKVNVVPNRSAGTPNPTDSCRGADAMTTRLAQLSATGAAAFPRLPLASPSVSRADLCDVFEAVDLSGYSAYDGAKISDGGFTTECTTDRGSAFLDFEVGTAGPPPQTHLQNVGGHKLYVDDDTSDYCDWYSVQGTTPEGKSERLALSTGATTPSDLCTQTGTVLAALLDKAGLT